MTPTQPSEPVVPAPAPGGIAAIFKRATRWIPPKARLGALAGLLALILLAVYTSLTSGSATLNLVCHHNLRTAELSVSIDGKPTYTEQISGRPKKRFRVFEKKVEGTFSKTLTLPSGEHVVEVHLKSAADGFDQTKRVGVNLQRGVEATLLVGTQRSGMLLQYQGPPVAPIKEAPTGYAGSLRSVLVMVVGSAASAVIGFLVQEFLRARKAKPG